jgi:hypothetical protein
MKTARTTTQRRYERIVDGPNCFTPTPGEHWVQLTTGMSGHFAVEVWLNNEEPALGPFPEPYNTGIGRYRTPEEAAEEAVSWADDMDVPCILSQALWDDLKARGQIK